MRAAVRKGREREEEVGEDLIYASMTRLSNVKEAACRPTSSRLAGVAAINRLQMHGGTES